MRCTLIANFTRLIFGKRDDDVKYFKSWTCKQALATYIYYGALFLCIFFQFSFFIRTKSYICSDVLSLRMSWLTRQYEHSNTYYMNQHCLIYITLSKGRNEFLSRKQKFNYWKNPEKIGRYDRIINELCHFYKVSLIKTGLMFHKYHLLNQLQVFIR
jgi:predicted nucleic acid-binding Zn finger protein